MVKLNKIYTKKGDTGETSLVGGMRVSKSSETISALGNIDELNALLGVIINELKKPYKTLVTNIQNDLFDIGADIATPIGSSAPKKANITRVNKGYVLFLEKEIDNINSKLLPLNSFILPGGSNSSALIHLARTVCRRSELSIVKLSKKKNINMEILKYINRLSDLLFVLARILNKNEILWKPFNKKK